MTSYVKTAEHAGDQFLAMLAAYQDMILRYYTGSAAHAGRMSPVTRQSLTMLQKASEANFRFWETALARQKAFMTGLFDKSASKAAAASRTSSGPATTSHPATSGKPSTSAKAADKQTPPADMRSKARSSVGAKSSRKSAAK